MNSIRFNQPMPRQSFAEKEAPEAKNDNKKSGGTKKFFIFLIIILMIAAVAVAGFFAKDKIFKTGNGSDSVISPYSAVFLSNGQVYFGKMISKNNSEIVLSNVYYLQLSENGAGAAEAQAQTNEPKFSLIKLGKEIHGPTDKLYINVSQVLFYESLRKDSAVVQSINSQN